MAKFFKKYLSFILFGLALLMGIQLPAFVEEYGKNLEARFAESEKALSKFQATADRHFNGDLKKLVQHYENKQDLIIVEGATSIKTIFERNQALEKAINSFQQSSISPYKEILFSPVADVREQVWQNYNFTISLSQNSIIFGFVFALTLLLLLELFYGLLGILFGRKKSNRILAN